MKTILFLLPALQEVRSAKYRQIKYSLFPPLSLLTLAALTPRGKYRLIVRDEHVENPVINEHIDLVAITVYISSAHRAYELSRYYHQKGAKVVFGGIHPTTLPGEAGLHADAICLGAAETAWPNILRDFEKGSLKRHYIGTPPAVPSVPPVDRRLFNRSRYLIPNTMVVSRGCPYSCDFCYKDSFWGVGYHRYRPFAEIFKELETLLGRFVFFLDDNLLGNRSWAMAFFERLRDYRFLWQAAGSLNIGHDKTLLDAAYAAGCRSLFIGFESLDKVNLRTVGKVANYSQDYAANIARIHDAGIMINGSFVYGFDCDGLDVFKRTVDFAINNGMETATFHILTPYPGTRLFARLEREGRILHRDWARYDTRHTVFKPAQLSPRQLEEGYWKSYEDFYSWGSLWRRAIQASTPAGKFKCLAYNIGWKKVDSLWNAVLRMEAMAWVRPILEVVLALAPETKHRTQSDWGAEKDEGLCRA